MELAVFVGVGCLEIFDRFLGSFGAPYGRYPVGFRKGFLTPTFSGGVWPFFFVFCDVSVFILKVKKDPKDLKH